MLIVIISVITSKEYGTYAIFFPIWSRGRGFLVPDEAYEVCKFHILSILSFLFFVSTFELNLGLVKGSNFEMITVSL